MPRRSQESKAKLSGPATCKRLRLEISLWCMKPVALCLAILFLTACESPYMRIDRLEKENKELRAQLSKAKTPSLEAQATCASAAKRFFGEGWAWDQDTLVLRFTNHYNQSLNKCFVLVQYQFYSSKKHTDSFWYMELDDAYERTRYGTLDQTVGDGDRLLVCRVQAVDCKSADDFNDRIKSFMND